MTIITCFIIVVYQNGNRITELADRIEQVMKITFKELYLYFLVSYSSKRTV